MKFFPHFWKKSNTKTSVFGGEVQSAEEVKALNERIKKVEQKELETFEKEFDEKLKEL